MSSVLVLPDVLLSDLVAEFADADTIGVLLAGSYARGDATSHSDIDLIRFAAVLPEAEADRYALAYREGSSRQPLDHHGGCQARGAGPA